MTDASPAPVNPTTTTETAAPQPAPAPQLSRRQSGTKVGSRVPSLAIATSGEGCPDTPSYTPVAGTPKSTPKGKEVRITTKITESGKSTPKARVAPLKSVLKGSGASTPNAGGGGTPRAQGEALKLLSLSSISSPHASLTSPPRHYRARSRPEADDGVPAAGLPYTNRYAVSRSTLRSIAGKSQSETDVLSLKPLPADYSPTRGRSKRVMDAAYSPTQLAYSNEESRQFQLDQRLSGKRTNAPHSAEAPWEHSQYKPASPKRAGSARPTVFTGNMPPWDRDNDATHNRSTRSHSCGAALRTREAPFGVTAGSDGSAFKKGDTKVIQGARAAGARPSTGRSTSRTPADHDILNPHGPEEKLAPSGRRPPPASSLEPSLEFVRPYSRKQVAEVEHTDRPQGKRGNAMATAPSEGSPFRTANDDLRFASLSTDQSAMGPQATNPPKPFSKVFYDGRSGGVQSFHIDPTNAGAVNSKFSPPRERPPTAKRNQSNIESAPGTDVDSLTKVCQVRYNRNKETLVGVMHPVPLRAVPQYDVVPPFATEAY